MQELDQQQGRRQELCFENNDACNTLE